VIRLLSFRIFDEVNSCSVVFSQELVCEIPISVRLCPDRGNSLELLCARDMQIWTDAEISIVAKEITDRIKLIMASSAATCGASARGQLVKQVNWHLWLMVF
jgi:hypothetical protein